MPLYPGAVQRHLNPSYAGARKRPYTNRVNLHTQAGNGSLFNFFNGPGKASSVFWVSKTGLVEQYMDSDMQAEADLDGNDATVSIETEGGTEPWTPEQLASIIALVRWLCDVYNLPKRLATSSKIGEESRGISWHRLGIDGNFPALPSRYAGRKQRGGGMHYSRATGKVCPGDARIDQIFDAVLPGVLGDPGPVPQPVPPIPAPDARPRNADGSLTLVPDGSRGPATIGRWQEVMGTTIDFKLSRPSSVVKADQRFLNKVVAPGHILNLTGKVQLDVDGHEGSKTIKVRQFWLYNTIGRELLQRDPRGQDFDGSAGPETTALFQHALNRATARSGRY